MNGDQAALAENDGPHTAGMAALSHDNIVHPKLPEGDARERVQRVVELADALLTEAEALAYNTFTADRTTFKPLDVVGGIDFYQEVELFERNLIKKALDATGGNQAKAARILGMKTSTLNSKIKFFNINRR